MQELAKLNSLSSPYHVKIGQKLKMGEGALPQVASKAEEKKSPQDDSAKAETASANASTPSTSHGEGGPLLHVGENPIPPASAKAEAEPQQASIVTASKQPFIWPVAGRILSGFGPKGSGRRNDGVNISAPVGTAVRATRAGEVIYVGNEVPGYGNLVLIRHDDGYVSAYAHNSRILVERGAFVQQGQEIAESGETGSVTAPQVHFEIRKDRKPVDPLDVLPKA